MDYTLDNIVNFLGTIKFLRDTTLPVTYTVPSRSYGSLASEDTEEKHFPEGTELKLRPWPDPLTYDGERRIYGHEVEDRIDPAALLAAISAGLVEMGENELPPPPTLLDLAKGTLRDCGIDEGVLDGLEVIWVLDDKFAFLHPDKGDTVYIFDYWSDFCWDDDFDEMEYGTVEEFRAGPGIDFDEFCGYVHFLEKKEFPVLYTWHCGDGCCSSSEREETYFPAGCKIKVWSGPYPLSFDYWESREDERFDPVAVFYAILYKEVELLPL